jgi:hypothetical protein
VISTPVLALIDRTTPVFNPFFSFRARIVLLLLASLGCLYFLDHVIRKKDRLKAPQYVFSRVERRCAKWLFVVLLIVLGVLGFSLQFFRGHSGPIAGRVLAASGAPLLEARVMLLDLDKKPIGDESLSDSQTGLFVIDPRPGSGQPAYFEIKTETCRETELLMMNRLLPKRNAEVKHELGRDVLVVRSGCSR